MGSTYFSKRVFRKPILPVRYKYDRAKTFKSEESAKAYAEKNKLENYKIVNIRVDEANTKPKFKIELN